MTMVNRLKRQREGLMFIAAGVVFGVVWAAGSTPGTSVTAAAPTKGVTSISIGDGLLAPSNPITSTGSIAVNFGGDGAVTSVSRSDHTHDARYVRQTGGIMSGNLAFTGNAQIIAPRIENADSAPLGAAAGRLWFDTTELRLKVHDGANWVSVPQIFSRQNPLLQTIGVPNASQALNCPVTFTLAADEVVLLDAGALGELDNLQVFTSPVLTISNEIRMTLSLVIDGGTPQTLTSWSGSFNTAPTTSTSRMSATTVPVSLSAGTHTADLVAVRSGTLSVGGALPDAAYACKISELWMRIHRP
jgi:hypothetical protein